MPYSQPSPKRGIAATHTLTLMFATYLMRELGNRRKQTVIIALGMALAIALVIVVNAVSAGVKDAQAAVLASVYGVGTDITVTQTPQPPAEGEDGGRPSFDFGADAGESSDGTTSLSQSRLSTSRGTTTFDASQLETVLAVDGVAAATGTLALENSTFSGQMPDMTQGAAPTEGGMPQGGAGGGSSFDIEAFTVLGLDVDGEAVGPLTSVALEDGRTFAASDAGKNVVVLDSSYATTESHAVGDTMQIGGEDFEIIGVISSTSSEAETAANSYVPLDVAQRIAGLKGQVSTISVQAASSDAIPEVQTALEAALPDATVSTQEDLAASVSGSLSTASSLVSSLGTWLSLIVLAAAFLIAILFTISGVSRRTREFGTLKAIGWTNRRIVGQVAGESLVQGAIGGALGVAIGLVGVFVINLAAPTLTAGAATQAGIAGGPAGMPVGGPLGQVAATTTAIVLQAPVTGTVVLISAGLAILGGVLAGAIGGWRAARLRPAEALRSVA
jgi:putative ABC transport system permease protein